LVDGTAANPIEIIGYNGSRTTTDLTEANMPVFTSATNSIVIFTTNAASNLVFRNIKVTHTAGTRGNGWANITAVSTGLTWINCIADGCLNGWLYTTTAATQINTSTAISCIAKNSTGTGTSSGGFVHPGTSVAGLRFIYCTANNNAGNGFRVAGTTPVFIGCLAYANTQSGFSDAQTTVAYTAVHYGCVAHGNTQHGFRSDSTTGGAGSYAGPTNCIAYGNSQYGFSCATTAMLNNGNSLLSARNNAVGSNTAGNYQNWATPEGAITLSADPFVNAAGGDFSLNTTAGGGAALRELGYPSTIGLTSNYASVGAAEPQATGGTLRSFIIG
jgi:hypothetical protein